MSSEAPFPSATKVWRDNTYPTLSPTRPELSAKGKSILITGGGTGIGAETARSFAAAGAARIALLGRREQPLLDTKASIEENFPGVEVLAASTDIVDKAQVDAVFAKFANKHKIDVVISNAAVAGPLEGAHRVDPHAFIESVNINIQGNLNVAQAFYRHAAYSAVAIDVSSIAAHLDVAPAFASYSVSKMAVARLWNALQIASPQHKVFHIQPGIVDTDMNKAAGGSKAIGREDHVSLPATFMVWLSSPEATFLKGKFIWANWDVDELKTRAKEIESSQEFNIQLVGWPFGLTDWKMKATDGAADIWKS